jgi:hypothetical protein
MCFSRRSGQPGKLGSHSRAAESLSALFLPDTGANPSLMGVNPAAVASPSDTVVLSPGELFHVSFTLLNVGVLPWPPRTRLLMVTIYSGLRSGLVLAGSDAPAPAEVDGTAASAPEGGASANDRRPEELVIEAEVPPGGAVRFSPRMRLPLATGHYHAYWSLALPAPHSVLFGDRVAVDVSIMGSQLQTPKRTLMCNKGFAACEETRLVSMGEDPIGADQAAVSMEAAAAATAVTGLYGLPIRDRLLSVPPFSHAGHGGKLQLNCPVGSAGGHGLLPRGDVRLASPLHTNERQFGGRLLANEVWRECACCGHACLRSLHCRLHNYDVCMRCVFLLKDPAFAAAEPEERAALSRLPAAPIPDGVVLQHPRVTIVQHGPKQQLRTMACYCPACNDHLSPNGFAADRPGNDTPVQPAPAPELPGRQRLCLACRQPSCFTEGCASCNYHLCLSCLHKYSLGKPSVPQEQQPRQKQQQQHLLPLLPQHLMPQAQPMAQAQQPSPFANFLQMVQAGPPATAGALPPGGFRFQPMQPFVSEHNGSIQRLVQMGFGDTERNRAALTRANGDVDLAVAHLLEEPSQQALPGAFHL